MFKEIILLIKMVKKSAKQMQSNGYRLNVEDSKYLIFESKDHCKKLRKLETMAFDLIDFCEFSEDNEEKQDDIYSRMLTMETYLESLAIIKIKTYDDKFDLNTQDEDDFVDPFEIEFPTINYYFQTTHLEDYSDFVTFYNTLKTDEVKQKFRDLFKAVGKVLDIKHVN